MKVGTIKIEHTMIVVSHIDMVKITSHPSLKVWVNGAVEEFMRGSSFERIEHAYNTIEDMLNS